MKGAACALQDSVQHLSVMIMIWKSVCVRLKMNFVIFVVKRKGENALQQSVCLRYEAVDQKYVKNIALGFYYLIDSYLELNLAENGCGKLYETEILQFCRQIVFIGTKFCKNVRKYAFTIQRGQVAS